MAVELCKFNQNGFCKFGDQCRKRHFNEICRNSDCKDQSCTFRHPQICRYFISNRSCKFLDRCAYLHKDSEERIQIENLQNKLAATEAKVFKLEHEINEIKNKFEAKASECIDASNHETPLVSEIAKEKETAELKFKLCEFKSSMA